MKILTDVHDLHNKTVIVRVDFNVPIRDGDIQDDTRIVNTLSTLQYLIKHNCKIILLTHRGRPNGHDQNLSLNLLIDPLQKFTGVKVTFCELNNVSLTVKKISYGQIVLVENIRFHPEEIENDLIFSQYLASLADLYVNDAFSCTHRNHASIATLPLLLPSVAGMSLKKEYNILNSIFDQSSDPTVAIIGGAKISTKLNLIHQLAKKVKWVIVGGALANNILHSQGIKIGKSLLEENINEDFSMYNNVIIPCDVVTAQSFYAKSHVCDVFSIPQEEKVLDIGPASRIKIKYILNNCKTVLWNGPLGLFEVDNFVHGTQEVAHTVAQLTKEGKIKSIVGGGDSICAINKLGIPKDAFTYISTAGGAFLELIAKQRLSNLDILKYEKKVH